MGFSSTDTRTSNSRTPSKVTLVTLDTNFPSFITQYMLRCGAPWGGGGLIRFKTGSNWPVQLERRSTARAKEITVQIPEKIRKMRSHLSPNLLNKATPATDTQLHSQMIKHCKAEAMAGKSSCQPKAKSRVHANLE